MKPAATNPTLKERIAAVHAEIDDLIAARIDEVAASAPGIPKANLEMMMFARADGCHCEKFKILKSES
jgi:hypothetical protein